jgi:thiamine-monophosphate kinase
MNEFALIARHFKRAPRDHRVRIGVGDDAAIIAPSSGCELAIAVDMLVEGRHFLPDVDPETLGHKTLAVNLSDMAAMGATPRWALLAGALPDDDDTWLAAFSRGLFALAARYDVELIGGDTTRGPRNLCLTIIGELPADSAITRAGARAGDDVYVSGTLGDAALALAAIMGRADVAPDVLTELRRKLETPEPRVRLGEGLRGVASAALDVSDGLVGDLAHILEASQAGAQIELAAVPCSPMLRQRMRTAQRADALVCVLAGGDDYELCFTAPAAMRDRVAALVITCALPLTRIGQVTAEPGLRVLDENGALLYPLPRAFDHFA